MQQRVDVSELPTKRKYNDVALVATLASVPRVHAKAQVLLLAHSYSSELDATSKNATRIKCACEQVVGCALLKDLAARLSSVSVRIRFARSRGSKLFG